MQDCSVSVYIHGSEEICAVRVIDNKLGVLICCDLCESVHLMSIYMLCECMSVKRSSSKSLLILHLIRSAARS